MKKILLLFLVFSAFISCKKETKSESAQETITTDGSEKTAQQNDGLTLLKGDFVFYDGAAVLQTSTNIYGVLITDKTHELNKKAEAYKSEPTDMVQVEIRGKITDKKDEKILWEHKVEIIEILDVIAPEDEDNNVVKLGN